MFLHQIDPVLLSFWQLEIRYYGLMYALGLIITYFFLSYLARQRKMPLEKHDIADFLFYGIIGVIAGARIFYVLFYNLQYYLANPVKIIAVWEGGLSLHGGLAGIIIVAVLFCRNKKISFWEFADLAAIPLTVALMFGRIGNFLNNELYGRIAEVPWAVKFQGVEGFRHPSQLYQSFSKLVIFSVLWCVKDKKLPRGVMFSLFLMMYSSFRFIVEFFRQPDPQLGFVISVFSMGQLLTIPVFLAGLGLFTYFYFHKSYKKKGSNSRRWEAKKRKKQQET